MPDELEQFVYEFQEVLPELTYHKEGSHNRMSTMTFPEIVTVHTGILLSVNHDDDTVVMEETVPVWEPNHDEEASHEQCKTFSKRVDCLVKNPGWWVVCRSKVMVETTRQVTIPSSQLLGVIP